MSSAEQEPVVLEPKLYEEVQAVLLPGESVAAFVHEAVQGKVTARAGRREFLKSAMASSQHAQETGRYIPASEVLARLEGLLQEATERAEKGV
jgi:hypothetical protein